MQANPGDFLIIASNALEHPPRVGYIEEVHGEDGAPPYVVKWEEDGRTTVVFPGPDAHIEHARAGHQGHGIDALRSATSTGSPES